MKFLVIGGGSIGKRHVRNLFALYPKCIIYHLYVFSSPLAPQASWNYSVFRSLESLPSDERYDACIIAGPASNHLEHLRFCLKKATKIFIEKPLCRSDQLNQIDQLMDLDKSRPEIFVGYVLRYDPIIQKTMSIITSSKYGRTLSARVWAGQFLPHWRPHTDYKQTVSGSHQLGGGVLHELSHELDYITYLLGFPSQVFAALGKYSSLDIDVEDLAHLMLIYPDKLVSLALDFYSQKPSLGFEILLEGATVKADFCQRKLFLSDSTSDQMLPVEIESFNHLYLHQFQALVDSKHPPDYTCDFENGMRVMELINALKSSSDFGRVVSIGNNAA